MISTYGSRSHFPFIGRKKELNDVTARLLDVQCRLLTLTGLGGSGKTRLAVEAAAVVAPRFAQGTVFVGLQALPRSDLLVPTIAQALGVAFYGAGEIEQLLLDYLHDKSLLLVLDNFEHLLAGATFVATMLGYAPGIKVLATSREALNLREEWLYPLRGMSTPPSVYSTSVQDYEAVQLFLYHARRVQPDFDPTSEQEAVVRLCTMTAGLPLAIELAASWLKGLSAAYIVSALQRNLDLLSTTTRNVEQRHRSMRAVFDRSWALLSEPERLIFARLSIFPGSFAGEAAVNVAQASLSTLAALVEKSLVELESADRFSIHEMLRQYGLERLEAFGETEATYARHGHYYAHLMQRHEAALKQPEQLETMRAIDRDFHNFRLAWERSIQTQRASHLHAMLNGLYLFGFLGSRDHETMTMFQDALEQTLADAPLHGRLLARRWGFLQWWYQEDYTPALTRIEQALAIARAENNRFETAFCHLMAAYAMIAMQRYAEALPHLEASRELFEALDEPYYVCWVLHRLGYVYLNLYDHANGLAYTEQSLALARVAQIRVAQVICLYNLGSEYLFDRNYAKARHMCADVLRIATETGNQCQIAHALSLLAMNAFFQGDFAACRDYAARSQLIIDDINLLVFQPFSRHLLIVLACVREDYAEALRLKEAGIRLGTSMLDLRLHYWTLAVLACGLGSPTDVRLYTQQALQLVLPDMDRGPTILMVPCVAFALADTDRERAVELLSWVFSSTEPALSWARQWPLLARLQARLEAAMDSGSYQRHSEQGEALSLDNVNTYLQRAFTISPEPAAEAAELDLLTAREHEILRLMAAGLTNAEIAEQLVIGAGTVKTHTLHIYRKLDVANRTQAIIRAQQAGILRS